ncbi:hypothetical protein V6N11_028474 [Hibiscus sabdariffa]|uniref:Uncharacterized protein n=1 Tax=Hibiscus sabdariffa TaxID=183260 RepID=A0ABR2A7Z7_9ROSI
MRIMESGESFIYLSQKYPIGAKKIVEIDSLNVMRTKWLIPSSRAFLRRIFTIAKEKSIAIIPIKGYHSLQLFNSATESPTAVKRAKVRP